MSEMIERVARALCVADHQDPDRIDMGEPKWCDYTYPARIAIQAMEEPTGAMLAAAHDARDRHSEYTYEGATYAAMIQAALKEPT